MHLKELAKLVGYAECTTRTYLGRAEFSDIKLIRGQVIGVQPHHIERLKTLMSNQKGVKNASNTTNPRHW